MDERHDLLERDYVIVKIMSGLDEHSHDVISSFDGQVIGIPWFAITDADGKVLATSDSPMGNIGMPTSPEEIGHMRKVLAETANHLTDEELDKLANSLIGFK